MSRLVHEVVEEVSSVEICLKRIFCSPQRMTPTRVVPRKSRETKLLYSWNKSMVVRREPAASELLSQVRFVPLNPSHIIAFRHIDPVVLIAFGLFLPTTFDVASHVAFIVSRKPVSGCLLELNL